MKTVLAALALLFPTVASSLVGQGEETLAGLKGVSVYVERIKDEVQRDGLEEGQILTDVEVRLRQAGVPVLTKQQSFDSAGSSILDIDVHAVKATAEGVAGFYAYHVHIELSQEVRLVRKSSLKVHATTWSAGSTVGVVAADRLRSGRDIVRDQTDRFINAYLAANPKR